MPDDTNFFGKMPARTEITVLLADECFTIKLELIIKEPRTEIMVFNPRIAGNLFLTPVGHNATCRYR